MSTGKPRLLVISDTLPLSPMAGNRWRVYNMLTALRANFAVTFLYTRKPFHDASTADILMELCDGVIDVPSAYWRNRYHRLTHRLLSSLYATCTGLKRSNYILGRVEYTAERLARWVNPADFSLVLFEYWHAYQATELFNAYRVPCILDMHDIQWRSYQLELARMRFRPALWKQWAMNAYRTQEEAAWHRFDAVIAINRAEADYARGVLPEGKTVFYTPMGIDLAHWHYMYQPTSPPRVAYYGGLGRPENVHSALHCYYDIMPLIWAQIPNAEFWLVGSNPPTTLRSLANDQRVHVTGYVEDPAEVLRTMSVVLCPWEGTFGFRSRVIEVMSLGIPVVASPNAVYGMELEAGKGIILDSTPEGIARQSLRLIQQPECAMHQSKMAYEQISLKFSLAATYGRLAGELLVQYST